MAEILGIARAMAEALGLEQIIPPELRRDRRNAARRARRQAAGGQSRGEFLEGWAVSRDKPWIARGISRSTWYARGLHEGPGAEPAPAEEDPYRIFRRPQLLEGWGLWKRRRQQNRTRRSCAIAR
jgi:hypothetical protein